MSGRCCMRHLCGIATAGVFLLMVAAGAPGAAEKPAWTSWRGPNRDGVSTEKGLLQKWSATGPKLLWRVDKLGKGYASVTIADGNIFTMGNRGGKASLFALDVADGRELWSTPVGSGDPNCTPTVDGERVFALGREGDLVCAETGSGDIVWKKTYSADFGGVMMSHWGYSESPLVDGEKLICTPGGQDALIVALDKNNGELIWKSPTPENFGTRGLDGAGYSSIVVSEACGIKQYVQLTGRGLVSVAADDGRTLWTYNRIANSTANIPTPIVSGDYVFTSTGYQTGAALLHLQPDGSGIRAIEKYFLNARTMQNHHGGMVKVGDYIYCGHGHNRGAPLCVEMLTGKVRWVEEQPPGRGSAAVVFADGKLYFRFEDGLMALISATPEKYTLNGTFKLASQNGRSWPHPVIVDRKLYLRDQQTLLCYNVADPRWSSRQ